MGGTIVCGVTDSPGARAAAQLAAALSARLGLRLVLVHVVEGVPAGAEESVTARQRLLGGERLLQGLGEESPGGWEARLVVGDPVRAIANIAAEEGADLVVVGARSVGPRGRKLASSLAQELPTATPVPIVVAPPSPRKRTVERLAALDTAPV
jgi:nucleotide-binding universal stress UspA family protein